MTVRWMWNDGTTGEFSAKSRKQAEAMVIQLYLNPCIVSAEFGD